MSDKVVNMAEDDKNHIQRAYGTAAGWEEAAEKGFWSLVEVLDLMMTCVSLEDLAVFDDLQVESEKVAGKDVYDEMMHLAKTSKEPEVAARELVAKFPQLPKLLYTSKQNGQKHI